ncbi:MAG TPA: malto-oligosyltrehalose trehalohydrolase [Thermoanaerobaculia bacterium]|nr:malto-oligosyltrehalose trehalohydrolase [Thermoanaerobaculia bacterium]
MSRSESLGATLTAPNRTEFRVWAPFRDKVSIEIVAPSSLTVPMVRNEAGYHEAFVDVGAGARYLYLLDGVARPDPASRSQPEGVHGPSEVVGSEFEWHDAGWRGIALTDFVIYELHVGTFTEEGTFDAAIGKLDALRELGITAVELMPVAQFPGTRNWGYDGAYIGAPQNSYGGPAGLKRLVDAAHQRGLAVVLDVVYNHLGPEGNYIREFGPYFTTRYKTPWGDALNFDGPHSDDVRWFFVHNALMWAGEYHIDALRVDAVHAIVDHSAQPFLQDLTTAVRERARELSRRIHTLAESDLNDPRVIAPRESFGLGFDAQWSDDLHHTLHALLTGEQSGYYRGFGKASDLARVFREGYFYSGQFSPYRGRRYGLKPENPDGAQFVVCAQNHDQIGNRMRGERLTVLVSREQQRLAAAVVIFSPFLPLFFMGEEYGETAPFQYFTSHSDAELIEAVRRGRREEFREFEWTGEFPDPHAEATFVRSRLTWNEERGRREFYRTLLRLRREHPALRSHDMAALETHADDARRLLLVRRWSGGDQVLLAFNFGDQTTTMQIPFAPAAWEALFETEAAMEGNSLRLPPSSFALYGA